MLNAFSVSNNLRTRSRLFLLEKFSGEAATPAAKHLYDINEDFTTLDKNKETTFHNVVVIAVFLRKRAQLYLKLTVYFLSTGV